MNAFMIAIKKKHNEVINILLSLN